MKGKVQTLKTGAGLSVVPLNDEIEFVRSFLLRIGVAADVRVDELNEKVIVISTEDYTNKRAWIEAWFTLIEQEGEFSYFHERLRGTGETR